MADTEDVPEVTPHVFVLGEGGSVFKLDLPLQESISERLAKGYLTRVANAAGDPYIETESAPAVAALPTERPDVKAHKAEWVGWAVAHGMKPDDADAATKTDLIEKFGTAPAASSETIIVEPAPEGTIVTPENAGVVTDADGIVHVGELPATQQ